MYLTYKWLEFKLTEESNQRKFTFIIWKKGLYFMLTKERLDFKQTKERMRLQDCTEWSWLWALISGLWAMPYCADRSICWRVQPSGKTSGTVLRFCVVRNIWWPVQPLGKISSTVLRFYVVNSIWWPAQPSGKTSSSGLRWLNSWSLCVKRTWSPSHSISSHLKNTGVQTCFVVLSCRLYTAEELYLLTIAINFITFSFINDWY